MFIVAPKFKTKIGSISAPEKGDVHLHRVTSSASNFLSNDYRGPCEIARLQAGGIGSR